MINPHAETVERVIAELGTDASDVLLAVRRVCRTVGRGERLRNLFTNKWLWAAVLLSLIMQIAVVYVPFLQNALSTASLRLRDWIVCAAVGSSVLWLLELGKIVFPKRPVNLTCDPLSL